MSTSPVRRLLVAFDGSSKDEAALRWALGVAGPLGAEVEVVHALGLIESSHLADGEDAATAQERAHAATEAALRATIESSKADPTLHVELTVASGHPVLVLLGIVADRAPDLLVVGRRKAGAGFLDTLGSVSRELAGQSSVPVVVVPQT